MEGNPDNCRRLAMIAKVAFLQLRIVLRVPISFPSRRIESRALRDISGSTPRSFSQRGVRAGREDSRDFSESRN